MNINQRFKVVRKTLNMSQAQFAKTLSMSSGYVAGIELEHNKVSDRIVKLVCFTFNVNVNWLKNGDGEMFLTPPDSTATLAQSVFEKLKPEYKKYVLKQIDELLEIQDKEKKEDTKQ